MSATTSSSVTTTPTTATVPAGPTLAADPIRVERGHRVAWVATGVAVVVLSGAGIIAARTASTSTPSTSTGSSATNAVARTDAVESAHGHGASIRTGAGPAVVAGSAVASVPGPVVHRTPPRGMVDPPAGA